MVQAKHSGDVFSIDFKDPESIQRKSREAAEGANGEWMVKELLLGTDLIPLKTSCSLVIQEKAEKIAISLRVVNTMFFSATKVGEELLDLQGGASTLMAGPDDLMDLERRVAAAFQKLQ